MNMKYSLVFIIVLGLLCGCVRQRKADASDTGSIEMTQSETDALTADSVPLQGAEGTSDSLQGPGNAIYYWKTVFRLTVLPFATTLFQDTIPAGIEIVPTVYITTKAIRQDADFAEAMYKRIRAMMTRHHIRNVREVQVDCDWTAKTQKAFFRLCQRLRDKLHTDSLSLSATIRLHQLKKEVPPVDKGVLMLYNTGSIYNPETENSILSYKDVQAYLKSKVTYGLPLDFAYPAYSWGILMENGNFRAILHEVDFSNTLRYKETSEGNYLVLQEHYLENHHIRKGNVIRLETSKFNEIMRVKQLVASQMKPDSCHTILYHLDSLNLSTFEEKEINQIYTHLP